MSANRWNNTLLRKEAATIVDDRKLKVLAAVVDEYIKTGEPVLN